MAIWKWAAVGLVLLASELRAQTITEFPIPTPNVYPDGITRGPDGAVWFTESAKIGRITSDGVITEFPLPGPRSPYGMTTGPDGALWFVEYSANAIGRMTTSGTYSQFPVLTPNATVGTIAAGPDNALWFTEFSAENIGRITTSGQVVEYALPTPPQNEVSAHPSVIAAGPDGNMWFTGFQSGKIGKITMNGVITIYSLASSNSRPTGIVAGPDGALWFAEMGANKIGRITTVGVITEFALPNPGSEPTNIAVGPDGAMWFTQNAGNRIGRITTSGTITQIPIPAAMAVPGYITSGADGNVWFTEGFANKIGRVNIDPPAGNSPLVASVLPTSRSVQVGNTATAFASIINNSDVPLGNCRIQPDTFVGGFFSYQTTDLQTNALTGKPGTSTGIAARGLQTFVIAVRAGAPYPPTDVKFSFICDGVKAAVPIVGINTLLLTFSNTPVADMIAVGLTPSGDGFSRTGGPSGTGIFAVATTNIGTATALTAKPRLSDSSMPITATICETNAQAQCKAPPSATVSRTFNQNEASTFSVFLAAAGAIAADPAKYRVFVEFLDSSNVVRGSTSTAVTTQ